MHRPFFIIMIESLLVRKNFIARSA